MKVKLTKILTMFTLSLAIGTPLIATACGIDETMSTTPKKDTPEPDPSPTRPVRTDAEVIQEAIATKEIQEKHISTLDLNNSLILLSNNRKSLLLLPTFMFVEKNIQAYKSKFINILTEISMISNNNLKIIQDANLGLSILNNPMLQNDATNLTFFIFDFISSYATILAGLNFGDSVEKYKNEFIEIVQDSEIERSKLQLYALERVAILINSEFFENKNKEIDAIQSDLKKAIDVELTKIKLDDNSRSVQKIFASQIENLVSIILPKITESATTSIGWSNINDIGNGLGDFDINNISSAANDAIFITPSISIQSNSSFTNNGILYIPNKQNKLNVLTPNFQKILDSFKTLSKEAEKGSDALSKRNKFFYDEKIKYYTNILENAKNPLDLTNNRLIASHLNTLDLKDKYVLRLTRELNVNINPNNPRIGISKLGVRDITINKETKKIVINLSTIDKNRKLYLQGFTTFVEPFKIVNIGIATNSLTEDFYIPINKEEFNEVFLNGKDPITASKDSNLDLDLSKILELKIV